MNRRRDVATPAASMSSSPGRNVIATIGVDRYASWPQLSLAVSDAKAARERFHQLGFEDAAPPLYDEAATGDALLALVTDGLKALSQHDRLIVFYAGHGGTQAHSTAGQCVKTGYLIPADAASESTKLVSWIDLDDWLRKISLLPPRHILVILDSRPPDIGRVSSTRT